MALGSECPGLLHNLKVIETMPEETTTRSVYDLDVDRADRMELDKLSKELYEVLVRMAKEYPSVPILWKMAALMELCPADVQDMVCQTIDDVHEDYERLKQKILSLVSNKMSLRNGPVPMDIGRVDGRDSTFEFGVDAIWQQFAVLQLRRLGTRFPRVPV